MFYHSFRAVFIQYKRRPVDTSRPYMLFADEVVRGTYSFDNLVCFSGSNSSPLWYHPYGRIVQNYENLGSRPHTNFAQLHTTRTSKLIYDTRIHAATNHDKVFGLFTCRYTTADLEGAIVVGIYSRMSKQSGFPG